VRALKGGRGKKVLCTLSSKKSGLRRGSTDQYAKKRLFRLAPEKKGGMGENVEKKLGDNGAAVRRLTKNYSKDKS